MTGASTPRRSPIGAADLAVLLGLLAVAAVLRLPDLATRGTWDADQGHDMLVLRAFVRDGVVPLLGPPTSIGDFHHGALYYLLLAPAAFVTGGDLPLAVTTWIALAGIAAVGVTWWLGRSIAGPVAGLVAGLVMAVSSSAVDESTFIWNPNLIALSSALALSGAWAAWSTRRARWWLLAAVGTAMTMQCHVLGVSLLPIIAALLVADVRRRAPGEERRRALLAGLAGLAIIAVTYVPLAIHELTTDFAEVNAALDWLRAGGEPSDQSPPIRALVILTRVVSWPLTGLLTDAPIAALLAVLVVAAIVVWRWRSPDDAERVAVRWLGLGLLWTAGFLTFAATGLGRVVPGLPNDHYHAFADPMVFTLVGIGASAAVGTWRARGRRSGETGESREAGGAGDAARPADVAVALLVVVAIPLLLVFNVLRQPPAVAADGGFPAAEAAASRIIVASGGTGSSLALRSLPDFKPSDTYGYPLVRAGMRIVDEGGAGTLVIVCDDLFRTAIGAACGGPAEDASNASGPAWPLVDRFEAAPGRWVSVYRQS